MALTGRQEEAAALVAAGILTEDQIADHIGVARKTLFNWRQTEAFGLRVDEVRETIRDRAAVTGIALLGNRVAALNERWERMKLVIKERAADEAMKAVPGGKTGLLAHNVKGIGKGEDFQLIDIYEVDTGILKELREHERQAAQELGQWLQKTETTHTGAVVIRTITAVQPALPAVSDDRS